MKKLILLLALAGLLPWFATSAPQPSATENMQAHHRWAREAPTIQERIKRLEGFWAKYLPGEEEGIDQSMHGYGDGSHVLAIAGCAWELARAYIEIGEKEKALKMLDWIQKHDSKSRLITTNAKG